MVSKKARRLLSWMKKHYDWFDRYQISKALGKEVDYLFIKGLCDLKYIDWMEPIDPIPSHFSEDPVYLYRISDMGIAFLESYIHRICDDVRSWLTTIIAVAAFLLSVLSLYLQYR